MNNNNAVQHTAYISSGSNIGEKLSNCQKGIAALTDSGDCVLQAQSKFYMTEPVDYMDQDWFVNAVIKITTGLAPLALLHKLKSVELQAGRTETVRFGPRVLDMDILLYDNIILNDAGLSVPHPRMHRRRFVLQPICDIDPTLVHPVLQRDMQFLLNHIKDDEQRIVPVCLNY
jgi:2-amino-4-hydroxy-6-hydroxymethyldihydropteridine diphosphokinase